MPTIQELLDENNNRLNLKNNEEEDKEIGTIRSILSGVASGVFKIPEGVVSLGANLNFLIK